MAYSTEELLERAKDIRKTEYQVPPRGVIIPDYISGPKYNKWLNDIKIKAASLPDDCPLKKELNSAYFFKDSSTSTFDRMIGLLESLLEMENDYKKVLQEVNMKKMQTKDMMCFNPTLMPIKTIMWMNYIKFYRSLVLKYFMTKNR